VLGEELGQPVLTTAQAQLVGALGATAVAGWAS